jgi:2-polyprenyl-3-methyl-5-hydroxy-6-metoxy-1,4-benzoquinol methylase
MESFRKTYETDVSEVTIGGRRFRLFTPKYIEPFLDPDDVTHEFPLWCKIWEASLVLADHLAAMVPQPGERFLEIGGGLGLVSIAAASFGHAITMSEHTPHALEFAGANALENGCPDLEIMDLDWNHPSPVGPFDRIVGSEVVYHERDFEPLERLFNALLKPGGEVLIASGVRNTSMAFFARMQERYLVQGRRKTLRGAGKEVAVILASIKAAK